MKKFLSIALALLMVCVMLPTIALADLAEGETCVAKIGETKYETLDKAIQAAANAETPTTISLENGVTVYLTSGTAHENNNSRNVKIVGNGTQTVDVIQNAVNAEGGMLSYQRGSKFAFENVTVKAGEGNFDGIVCSALTFNNCTITGKLTLYGAATFTGCTFMTQQPLLTAADIPDFANITYTYNNTMDNQYSIWTWGGTTVTFTNCTFNTNGKAILLYGQATAKNPTNLVVNNCTFNDRQNGAAGKAAIEIGNDYNATYHLTAKNNTVNGFAPGKNTGSTLWGNKNNMSEENLTLTVEEKPTQIVIITPTEETPKTDDQKNPSTGANDMVAAAAALMAVAALGMAVLSRKK